MSTSPMTWSGPRPRTAGARGEVSWTISNPTFDADSFDRDRRASPWAGHRWFAYDLIRFTRPASIVELGTHYGCSFFAFCQAVRDLALNATVTAVDTWAGDEHAGRYDGVYELVRDWTSNHFDAVSTKLIRATFDEALDHVPLGSVDLLHIDGFHTYEAVSHDYSSWVEHLSSRATVLFHDVDPDCGYGSADFWRDLSSELGGWTFQHNFGLGVLTRDSALAEWLSSPEFATVAAFYPARAAADLYSMQVEDLESLVEAKQTIINQQDLLILDRDQALLDQAAMIDAKQVVIEHQDFLLADRDEALAGQAAMIDAKQVVIEHQDFLIADRDEALAVQAAMIDAKQLIIEDQGRLLADRDVDIATLRSELAGPEPRSRGGLAR